MSSFVPDITNKKFSLAVQLVNQSNRNIFLTGKAGTGKTTFLKYIRAHCPKQMVVLAPTGVAAINAGGVTIHSFFQLPLAPFIPLNQGWPNPGSQQNNSHTLLKSLRYNNEKRKQIQQLELLIIDEISMVRADLLDEIDLVLRHMRHRLLERFGGVQVLFIGDMLQLPPVVKDEEWQLLSNYYKGPFFFNSLVLRDDPPLHIEFDKIYRQNEEIFLKLLNKIRDNALDEDGLQLLESRFDPAFEPGAADGYIILTTHNNKANQINSYKLAAIEGEQFNYNADIKDEFPDRAFPAEAVMNLKVGAQVMFIRNDSNENGKRFFNGKIGTVSRLERDKIFVTCRHSDEDSEIEVQQETWENIRYKINKATGNLDTEVLGSFKQFPLRLAWAITIHKSQGLTFEKAIIDAGAAFAPGQVYVALSRCTTLFGLVLKSRILGNAVLSNPEVVEFSRQNYSGDLLESALEQSKKEYLLSVLLSTFDFSMAQKTISDLFKYISEYPASFNETRPEWRSELTEELKSLQHTANRFQSELKQLFTHDHGLDESLLHKRVSAGAGFFINAIGRSVTILKNVPLVTDSWIHAKEVNENISYVHELLAKKQYIMEGFAISLSIDSYHERRQNFRVPTFRVNVHSIVQAATPSSAHPLLHKKLKALRDRICLSKNLPVYLVASGSTLDEMVEFLPQELSELRKIRGFGDAKVEKYGAQFLEIINEYSAAHNLDSRIEEKETKKERRPIPRTPNGKPDTRTISYDMYKKGNSIEEIARQRKLTVGTIEEHLRAYIQSGDLKITEVLAEEKVVAITEALKDWDKVSITPVKQKLGADYGYGEIRMVISHLHSSHS